MLPSNGMRRERKHRSTGRIWLLLLLGCIGSPAGADQVVPAGGTSFVYNGLYDLACTDLKIGGTLDTGTGQYINVRNVIVGPGGVLQGNGSIQYAGTLTVNGTIGPGVTLTVAPASNLACPGPSRVTKPPQVIPAVDNTMLLLLAAMLGVLASFTLNDRKLLRYRSQSKGAGK